MRATSSRSSTSRTICADLALHDLARGGRHLLIVAGGAQDVEARADRRERVAQLVRERGEEFVLAAIGLLQRLHRAHALGDVDAESVQHRRLAVRRRTAARPRASIQRHSPVCACWNRNSIA